MVSFLPEGTVKYCLDFSPPDFWQPLADSYKALPWECQADRLRIVAENYSYLLDILVHARLFYIAQGKAEGG
ncbi:MAG: hypothetical protein A4E45_00093 [Methanosaeta sp. PtaB.Bin039]|nr:MAG: hypothetical protein A4E45_00093 [Methanosaeta sp. PtaB.Bin039]OPY47574.1 MAG: hypothetical protein A4E47_00228 [Methanosaeta sp. PtaU1.Bin028]HQJ28456.1 hypothetical protein [Methanotrichaceae archaeon]